ncbi:MAG: esterase-like activity of phytase family protein [Planctomycetota bacterium]
MRWISAAVLLSLLLTHTQARAEPELVGFAKLPPHTFRDGPTSGQFIDLTDAPFNGVTPPFENKQPVQGISSMIAGDEDGTYLALSDNGFGSKANSADYILCVYEITPNFRTAKNPDGGDVDWSLAFELSDPNNHVPWPIVADGETYPNSDIPVPAVIREKRLLTGADFDVESMVRLPDGTFWIGDEFGPFLLHFDAQGRLMEPPVELPGEGMHSPDHPTKDPEAAKIQRSGGVEGLTTDDSGSRLFAVLEKPIQTETQLRRFAGTLYGSDNPFGVAGRLTGNRVFELKTTQSLGPNATALGATDYLDLQAGFGFLSIERDSEQGEQAKSKTLVFGGSLKKWTRRELADLLGISDTSDLNHDAQFLFVFPFLTIESVLIQDEQVVLICNDNNYPFTNGRGTDDPDATEFILIEFDKPLTEFASELDTEPRP